MIFVLFIVVAIQCGYAFFFLWGLRKARLATQLSESTNKQFVSVIICAKNEAENLSKHLSTVLEQNYCGRDGNRLFEVIVVNDCSEDKTEETLRGYCKTYPQLKVLTIAPDSSENIKGKKAALAKGVAAARGEWLLFTDADCKVSGRWIDLMTRPLTNGKEIVAGYGGYNEGVGLLNKFIRAETMHSFIQYNAYTHVGMPYMAVGRNMACVRSVAERVMADELWSVIPSGDDDLLVRIAGTKDNVAIVCDRESFTYSSTKESWSDWVQQKQRHLSTGKYYKPSVKLLLGLYGVTHALVWVLTVLSLFQTSLWWWLAIGLFLIRALVFSGVWNFAEKRLGEKGFVYFFPVFDFGWLIYNFAFLPYIAWKNKTNWK